MHSYLFTGPRGIGKTTVARLLAKAVNCTGKKEGDYEPCNECENCVAMSLGNALNIIEIDAASHTGVDNVREKIIENVRFAPSGAKYRVFIIDEAHMLSSSAFNALLKTLEEPPGHTIFILATTELHKVPATIVSRCQRFDFKNFTAKEIVGRLEHLASSEGVKIEKSVLEKIAYIAEGGLRDAESILGQLLSMGLEEIGGEDADLVLPKSDTTSALLFLEHLVYKNGREAMLLLDELRGKGVDFKYFTDEVIKFSRALLRKKITGEDNDFFTADINFVLVKLSETAKVEEVVKIMDLLLARRADLRAMDIPSLPLELVTADICGEGKEMSNVKCEMSNENKMSNVEIKNLPAEGIPSQAIDSLSLITDKWSEVLTKIKDYNHSLPFILGFSKPISFDGKKLVLAIKFKLHKEKLNDKRSYSVLTEVLKSVYNRDVIIEAVVDESLPGAAMSTEEEVPAEKAFE